MTTVYCPMDDCSYYTLDPDNEEEGMGICTRESICLDERVDNIMYGCPEADWIPDFYGDDE